MSCSTFLIHISQDLSKKYSSQNSKNFSYVDSHPFSLFSVNKENVMNCIPAAFISLPLVYALEGNEVCQRLFLYASFSKTLNDFNDLI